MEEANIFTPYYFFDVAMSVIAIIVNVYAYVSLKKTYKIKSDKYLSHFSKGFFAFALSTFFSLFSFIIIILFAGIAADSPHFEFFVALPYNIAFAIGLIYFVLGIKNSKVLRAA